MKLRMHLHQPTTKQSGFSIVEMSLVIFVVAALAATGFVVYQHHKPSSAKNSAATSQTQMTTQPKSTTTQPAVTATQYLTIKEWGVKLPLSGSIKSAYYTVEGSNQGADNLPNTAWLGLTSLNSTGCNISTTGPSSTAKPIGSILRVLPTDHDPVTGALYTQQYPNGTIINGYYYAYAPWKNKSCASAATLQSIDSAFATAAKGIVPATQYLTIKEWGVRLTLNSTTASLYYYIKPNLPNVAYLSLKTISDVAPDCAANKTSLGAIARLTEAEQQTATANHTSDLNPPGTIHIGNYWYFVDNSHAACTDGTAAMNAAVSKAAPNYNPGVLLNTLNTLAADPSTN